MAKEIARIRRSRKQRALLQKAGIVRLAVFRSSNNISAQLIDSSNGNVLASASSLQKDLKIKVGGNIDAAKKVGSEIAKKSIDLGHKKVSFDRSGYKFHGRVKALADGAREGGLDF
jgi:large subunit ribosomal protein L18